MTAGSTDEFARFRRAAEDPLPRLDWCVGYLHDIQETGKARALARNRS